MKRTLVLAACALLVAAIGTVAAQALTQRVYEGQLRGVIGSAVKLRLDPDERGGTDIVRSFTARYFDVVCAGGGTLTMRRAKLIGEVPVGRGGGFSVRDDNGAIEIDGSVTTGCDSGRLRWRAHTAAG
jgi:hypothetical protein